MSITPPARMNASSLRQEIDFLGSRSILAAVNWGAHTARAVENFPVSGRPLSCMKLTHPSRLAR